MKGLYHDNKLRRSWHFVFFNGSWHNDNYSNFFIALKPIKFVCGRHKIGSDDEHVHAAIVLDSPISFVELNKLLDYYNLDCEVSEVYNFEAVKNYIYKEVSK